MQKKPLNTKEQPWRGPLPGAWRVQTLALLIPAALHRDSPNKLLSEESVGSLGHHWGSWVGEAIQSGWGLLDGEGRLLELSLPFSFAGERGTPSPVNQNLGQSRHVG